MTPRDLHYVLLLVSFAMLLVSSMFVSNFRARNSRMAWPWLLTWCLCVAGIVVNVIKLVALARS